MLKFDFTITTNKKMWEQMSKSRRGGKTLFYLGIEENDKLSLVVHYTYKLLNHYITEYHFL